MLGLPFYTTEDVCVHFDKSILQDWSHIRLHLFFYTPQNSLQFTRGEAFHEEQSLARKKIT
jgi:hypothetical protein